MSEVSLQSAYITYSKYRDSYSLPDFYASIVKGQAEYGYRITHLYSFIDIGDDIQLFYCRDGNHEDLLTSPHVKQRALLWQAGKSYDAPKYLKQAYAQLLDGKISDEAVLALGLPLANHDPKPLDFLRNLFGPKKTAIEKNEPEVFEPPSDSEKSAITLLGISGNFDGLIKVLKSKNPHIRATVAVAVSLSKSRQTSGGKFNYSSKSPLPPRALQILAMMLKDQDQEVRNAAEGVLVQENDSNANKLLAEYHSKTK